MPLILEKNSKGGTLDFLNYFDTLNLYVHKLVLFFIRSLSLFDILMLLPTSDPPIKFIIVA